MPSMDGCNIINIQCHNFASLIPKVYSDTEETSSKDLWVKSKQQWSAEIRECIYNPHITNQQEKEVTNLFKFFPICLKLFIFWKYLPGSEAICFVMSTARSLKFCIQCLVLGSETLYQGTLFEDPTATGMAARRLGLDTFLKFVRWIPIDIRW